MSCLKRRTNGCGFPPPSPPVSTCGLSRPNASSGELHLAAQNHNVGDHANRLAAHIEGSELTIALNARYLIDILSRIDQPQVVFEPALIRAWAGSSPLAPCAPTHCQQIGQRRQILHQHVILR